MSDISMELSEQALTRLFEASIKQNWNKKALSNYKGESYSNAEIAERIASIHELFRQFGIDKGDKVALVGKNSAEWCIVYLATISFGAVIVPILPDFKPEDTIHLINHSDAAVLFMDDSMFENISERRMLNIRGSFAVKDLRLLTKKSEEAKGFAKSASKEFKKKYGKNLQKEDFSLVHSDPDSLAVISYTSGTTGFSKGVMLPHRSLTSNVLFARHAVPLKPGSSIVSFLPLAHAYGCAFDFLYPLSMGSHITFLGKSPSPQVVLRAFAEIKPKIIFSVPLIIEKIYKNKILPSLDNKNLKAASKVPGVSKIVKFAMRRKLLKAFGGQLIELIIGGAPFNPEAETFFRSISFPFTVGYGMTECGPLISYASSAETVAGSCGKPVDRMQVRIDSKNPAEEVGEIMTKGANTLLGYYKNKEATEEILDEEGWVRTGDLGTIDNEQNIFIKGRSKTMLLGPSGKNIYPEEVEALLNNYRGVMESLVVMRDGKLLALFYPDYVYFDDKEVSITPEELFAEHIKDINKRLPAYLNLSGFKVYPQEFEKTPKRSIKRFLYNV